MGIGPLYQSLGWEDPLEREMATHSSILPGKSHGQRIMAGYSPWGCKESDTIERLSLSSVHRPQSTLIGNINNMYINNYLLGLPWLSRG